MYYKEISEGYITGIGETGAETIPETLVEIDRTEFENILEAIRRKPADTETTTYMLTNDLEYVEVEIVEPEEDLSNDYGIDEEIYNQIIDDYTAELMEGGML